MHIAWGGGEADKAANCILLIGLSEHYLLKKKWLAFLGRRADFVHM